MKMKIYAGYNLFCWLTVLIQITVSLPAYDMWMNFMWVYRSSACVFHTLNCLPPSQLCNDILVQAFMFCSIITAQHRSVGKDWTYSCTETVFPPPCCVVLDTCCGSLNASLLPVVGFIASPLCFPASSVFQINVDKIPSIYHSLYT